MFKFLISIRRRLNRYFQNTFLKINKRYRFVAATIIMSFLMLLSTFFLFEYVWFILPILIIASYFLTYFAVLEGIEKNEWLMLFLMPVVFTIAFYLFYFLFPIRWITRLPFMLMYAFSFYAIMLISNIFNVGVEKSLQLYRAAFSINYFYHALIIFLLMNVIFSFRQSFIFNGLATFIVVFPLALQLLWSVRLRLQIEKGLISYSLLIGLTMMELAVVFSFTPIAQTIFALFLTSVYYMLTGLFYHFLDEKLFPQTVREYLFVFGFVALIVLITLIY